MIAMHGYDCFPSLYHTVIYTDVINVNIVPSSKAS